MPNVLRASSAAFRAARGERRSGNLPEVLLWRELRKRPGGFKFRRQHPIGPYSLDFACLAARLCIEVDGEAHSRGNRPERDARRDQATGALGFETLRIAAREVLSDLDAVVHLITTTCQERQPLHRPAGGPPPRSGEVFLRTSDTPTPPRHGEGDRPAQPDGGGASRAAAKHHPSE